MIDFVAISLTMHSCAFVRTQWSASSKRQGRLAENMLAIFVSLSFQVIQWPDLLCLFFFLPL
jgi:hypothetical protein